MIYSIGLEDWSPFIETKYDLLWNQWCLGHLTDLQLVAYLERCAKALSHGGYIIVKENITRGEDSDIFDEVDNSVTRYGILSSRETDKNCC